jgi:hypothetical protein
MRVISSQSEAEICRRETRERLTYPLRQLTANLLRITRGAGKSYLLGNQLADCIQAFKDYIDAHGALPSEAEVHEILDYEAAWKDYRPWIKENPARPSETSETEIELAIRQISQGVLQRVASMLLDQNTQVSVGENRYSFRHSFVGGRASQAPSLSSKGIP